MSERSVADGAGVPGDGAPGDGGTSSQRYRHVPSTLSPVPEILKAQTWLRHLREDILPFWTMPAAQGNPVGNFPMERQMDGKVTANTTRRPRMLGRQSFVYALGYLMTGDAALLALAQKGCQWLLDHAQDRSAGGWYARLDAQGKPVGNEPKWAQDTAYALMGPAACYFLTRAHKYEEAILSTRDLLFDASKYWDATNKRIKDGLDTQLQQEADQENDGGWELVAQLDQLNAYMLLVQPVLQEASRREQMRKDMQTLGQTMLDHFFQDGIFWGVHNKKGQYGSRHVDFGHTLKSYWMLLQVDKRLPTHPFSSVLQKHAADWLKRAYDAQYGGWANRMTSPTSIDYNGSWWIFAEADQFAATLNLADLGQVDKLQKTLAFWKTHYVDARYKGVYDGRKRDGAGWGWPVSSTSKCNQWKNGYHATEHALIMYIAGHHLENKPLSLYFAIPAAQVDSFVARPYLFDGRVTKREDLGALPGGLRKVKVTFDRLF